MPPTFALDKRCAELTFEEPFDKLSLWDGKHGIWKTRYIWGNETTINGELQYYLQPAKDHISPFQIDNGILRIEAKPAPPSLQRAVTGNRPYTSGLLTTEKSFSQRYGRFEIRARFPRGKGLWPAFWMLPTFEQWPKGIDILPEIDVVEFLGHEPNRFHTTVHSNQSGKLVSDATHHRSRSNLTTDFHVYAVEWDEHRIRWYLNDRLLASKPTPRDLHQPMHMLVNLAVGGNWPGAPDKTTRFPAFFEIDHIRVYRFLDDCGKPT